MSDSADYCEVQLDTLIKLKDSTKQLLRLVEEIQSKTRTSRPIPEDHINLSAILDEHSSRLAPVDEESNDFALQLLKIHANNLDIIEIQNEDDDCSVYKRLTRKCTCLNRSEFNDFIIHFNEDAKSCTSSLGEIIKNLRILKKFLYMGGGYTRNSLLFLNEGLQKSTHDEKVDIIQACAHADICNVFDDDSLVMVCFWWTLRIAGFGDVVTQNFASTFLYRLAQVEEGRRYLSYSTKISNDIKTVLKKKSSSLTELTINQLHATLKAINPLSRHLNVTYYCKAEEGMGLRTLNSISMYRKYMTLEEIFTHLDWLNSFSEHDKGRNELTQYLPKILHIFKRLLLEYDNSEVNIVLTSILNNLLSRRVPVQNLPSTSPEMIVANISISTEPIPMKEANIQASPKNKMEKPALGFKPKTNYYPYDKAREMVTPALNSVKLEKLIKSPVRGRKVKEKGKASVIVVPMEIKENLTTA